MATILQLFARRTPVVPERALPKHLLEGHSGTISSVVFLQDKVHIVSGSLDGTMRKWNCGTGLPVGQPWKGSHGVYALALSPDGNTIACGKCNGSMQQWDTNGRFMRDTWAGHGGNSVRSLSWSHSGDRIASGFEDGTILIQDANSAAISIGPMETNQGSVWSVVYSPLGDRIASSGNNICIWDYHTGKLLVGPINDLGNTVYVVVWSLDGSKLYSACDKFASVFDSTSGTELYRFQDDNYLRSIALSPQHNLLACVGENGVTRLWNTEFLQPLGRLSRQENDEYLTCVSFSPNGRYLAYGGINEKITLWMVDDIATQPTFPAPSTNLHDDIQHEILPESQLPPSLDVDATEPLGEFAVNEITEERDNPYNNFFNPSSHSLPLPSPSLRYPWYSLKFLPRLRLPEHQSIHLHKRLKNTLFRRAHSPVPPQREKTEVIQRGKCRAVDEQRDGANVSPVSAFLDWNFDATHCQGSANIMPDAAKRRNGEGRGKKRKEPAVHVQTSPPIDRSPTIELDNGDNHITRKFKLRRRTGRQPGIVTQDPPSKVVEVHPLRHSVGIATFEPPSQSNSSDSGMRGPWDKFFDKICFPCGHWQGTEEDA